MTWEQTYQHQLDWLVEMAQKPGWWAYTQQKVIAMEAEPEQLWKGIRSAWGKRLKAIGFEPPENELGNWWEIPSKLPPLPRSASQTPERHR